MASGVKCSCILTWHIILKFSDNFQLSFYWFHERIPIQGVRVTWGWTQRCVSLYTYKNKTGYYHELVATPHPPTFLKRVLNIFMLLPYTDALPTL